MRTHGTISCYNNGCRCTDCRRASRLRRHSRRPQAVGVLVVHEKSGKHATQQRRYSPVICSFCDRWFYMLGHHEKACARG